MDKLIEISDRIEQANARRITALAKLSQIRGVAIAALMDELEIKKRRSKGSAKGLMTIAPNFD